MDIPKSKKLKKAIFCFSVFIWRWKCPTFYFDSWWSTVKVEKIYIYDLDVCKKKEKKSKINVLQYKTVYE